MRAGPLRFAERFWLAGVALLALVPFLPAIAAGRTLAWRDTALMYVPVRTLAVEAIRSFRLPLWNPYEGTGMPLLAEGIHGVLHPLSIAAASFAPRAGMDALILAQLAAAAAGAALLARALGASRWAAAAGGVAYGLSGYVVSMTANYVYLAGAAWLPWAVAGLRAAGDGRRFGPVAAACGTGLLALTGEAQSLGLALVLGCALAVEVGGARGLARAGAGAAAGLLAGAAQLVPLWSILPHTDRAWPQDPETFAFSPARILEWIAPGLFWARSDGLSAPVFQAIDGPQPYPLPFATSVFVGAPALALAAVGMATGRAGRLLGFAALGFLWLALGHHLGATQLLSGAPVWGLFRYSEKLVGPLVLCIATAAALGVDEVRRKPSRRLAAAATVLLAVILGGVAISWATRSVGATPGGLFALVRPRLQLGLLHAALGAAVFAAMCRRAARGRSERWLAPGLAALLWAEAVAATPFAFWSSGVRADRVAGPRLPAEPPGPRLSTIFVAPSRFEGDGSDPFGRHVETLARFGAAAYNVAQRVDNIDGSTGLTPIRARWMGQLVAGAGWRSLRRYGVTHVVTDIPRDPLSAGAVARAIAGGSEVPGTPDVPAFAVPHRAWASFAPGVVTVATQREGALAVVAMVEAGERGTVLEAAGEAFAVAQGRVLAIERREDRLRVEAEADGDAVLVVNDLFWPGWRAAIDGLPVRIYAADAIVRAVRFPAGRHVLEMRYEPSEVSVGLALSALGAVAVAALLAFAFRNRRIAQAGAATGSETAPSRDGTDGSRGA